MTYKDFLIGPIKDQIKIIGLDNNLAWHAFVLDAVSIEFLGKIVRCSEPSEIIKSGNEKSDFINTINKYFPDKYKCYSEFLYKNLRCGMTHFFGPHSSISLATRSDTPRNLEKLSEDKILLVFEEFNNDLCSAVDVVISENHKILEIDFLHITKR